MYINICDSSENWLPHVVELQFKRKLVLKIIHRPQVPERHFNRVSKKIGKYATIRSVP